MLFVHQWDGLTFRLIVKTGHDYSGGAVVQGLTLWSRIHVSGALMPAKSTLWVCHLWGRLGGVLVWSMHIGSGAFWEGLHRPSSAIADAMPGAT